MLGQQKPWGFTMQRFALTALLCLLAGAAFAGTFELTDPAAEIYKEQNAPPEPPPEPRPNQNMRCSVDLDTGECFCIEKASAKKVPMSQSDCAAKVHDALKAAED